METTDTRAADILISAHGKTYLTLQSVGMRLAMLAFEDNVPGVGVSDGRETERQAILAALEDEAKSQGAKDPREAVKLALINVAEIEDIGPKWEWDLDDSTQTQGCTTTPRLSIKCEISFGVRVSNDRLESK